MSPFLIDSSIFTISCLGVVLLAWGVRGKVTSRTANCRKCKYDLSAIQPAPSRCPECGRDLSKKRAVRPTLRRKRPIVILLGLCLLGSSVYLFRQYQWYRSNPTWIATAQTWTLIHLGLPLVDDSIYLDVCQELDHRVTLGTMSDAEITSVARYFLKTYSDPLSWQRHKQSMSAYDAALCLAGYFFQNSFIERAAQTGLLRPNELAFAAEHFTPHYLTAEIETTTNAIYIRVTYSTYINIEAAAGPVFNQLLTLHDPVKFSASPRTCDYAVHAITVDRRTFAFAPDALEITQGSYGVFEAEILIPVPAATAKLPLHIALNGTLPTAYGDFKDTLHATIDPTTPTSAHYASLGEHKLPPLDDPLWQSDSKTY